MGGRFIEDFLFLESLVPQQHFTMQQIIMISKMRPLRRMAPGIIKLE